MASPTPSNEDTEVWTDYDRHDPEGGLETLDDLFATDQGYDKWVVLNGTKKEKENIMEYRRNPEIGTVDLEDPSAPQWVAELTPCLHEQTEAQVKFFLDCTLAETEHVIFQPTGRSDIAWTGRGLIGSHLTLSRLAASSPTKVSHGTEEGEARDTYTYTLGAISVAGTWMVAKREWDEGQERYMYEPVFPDLNTEGSAEFNLSLIVKDKEAFERALHTEKETEA
jgi:hypothetical protein